MDEANRVQAAHSNQVMNPIRRTPEETLGTIQYSQALSSKHADRETTMSLARTQAFRVPWAPLKPAAHHSPQEVASRDKVGDHPDGTSTPTPATEKRSVLIVFPEEPTVESSDFILEDLLRRSQAKTFFMEEALQRSEWSQRRFWGINE